MSPLPKYDTNKVAIVGCGRVGMATAFALLVEGIPNELLLFGRSLEKIKGEELDLEHSLPFLKHAVVHATDNYEELRDSDVVIVTAGYSQSDQDTDRLDLTEKNRVIIQDMIPRIARHAPEAIIIIVTNPVDILTYEAYKLAGLPKGKIFGTGTILDTARFRFHVSEHVKVNPASVHAYILGEHGDSSFAALSSATIGGQSLLSFPAMTEEKAQQAYEKSRDAAYKIVAAKGATYYAIAVATVKLVKTILRDSKQVFPVSIPLHNYHGHSGVALSVPCVIGRSGVEQVVELKLSWDEKQRLEKSVQTLKQYL